MFAQQLVNGFTVGLVYGLLALGLSLAYSTTRVVNFAHGEMFALGAFIGLTLQKTTNCSYAIATATSVVLVAISAASLAYLILWKLPTSLDRSVATICLSLMLRDGMLLVFGSDSATFPPIFPVGSITLLTVTIPRASLVIVAATIVILLAAWFFIARTRWGIWMRATAEDEELAAVNGIHTRRTQSFSFGAGAGLAAIAGLLICPTWQVHYGAGTTVGLKAFAAAMIGGLGNLPGALLGGLILGLLETLLVAYLSSRWKDLSVYLVLLLVLVFLPNGILSSRKKRLS